MNRNFLSFLPNDYPYFLEVDYKINNNPVTEKIYSNQAHFTASIAGVILGGCLGAFILNGFSILLRLRENSKHFDWNAALLNMLVVTASGGCAAAIIIFLGNITETVKLGAPAA